MSIMEQNINNFNEMPYEIKYMMLEQMQCSDIVKMWYNVPSTHNIIISYLNKHNFNTFDAYVMYNLNKYVDAKTRKNLLEFPHRLCYAFMFFELNYYNCAIKYCTIDDDEQFDNFIKLMQFSPHIEDAYDLVINNDKEMVNKFVTLRYNTDLPHEKIFKLAYQLDYNQIEELINNQMFEINNDINNNINNEFNNQTDEINKNY